MCFLGPGRFARWMGRCMVTLLSLKKAGHDLEIPIMRKWKKPAIIEVTVGCEVTSYAPAQL